MQQRAAEYAADAAATPAPPLTSDVTKQVSETEEEGFDVEEEATDAEKARVAEEASALDKAASEEEAAATGEAPAEQAATAVQALPTVTHKAISLHKSETRLSKHTPPSSEMQNLFEILQQY